MATAQCLIRAACGCDAGDAGGGAACGCVCGVMQDLGNPPEYADQEPRLTQGPHSWCVLLRAACSVVVVSLRVQWLVRFSSASQSPLSPSPLAPRLRPNEYAKAPALFKDGIGSGNVVPGQLNDVWLLGALAAAANHPAQLVRNLVVSETDDGFLRSGVITFQFYKDGDWVPVSIDSRVPYGDPETVAFNSPIYGRCRDPNEVWVPLMEKALAKLHSNYVRHAPRPCRMSPLLPCASVAY